MGSSIDRVGRLSETVRAGLRGLRVSINDAPTPEFHRALEHLVPAHDEIGRWVHAELAKTNLARKRNVIVHHRGVPVLATTLRGRQDRWEVATSSIAPALRIPHRDGFLEPALSAVGLPILIQDYFGDAPMEFGRQPVKEFDSYVVPLQGFDLDAHWRKTRIAADIRQARRRSVGTKVVHDDPGTLQWTIDTWEGRWADDPSDETGAGADMRAIWPRLLDDGVLRITALVADDDTPIASNVTIVVGSTLLGLINARNTTFGSSVGSIGTLALVECIDRARASGLSDFDLGGYHDYKRRFTPESRTAYEVDIAPRLIAPETLTRMRRRAGRAKRAIGAVAARLSPGSDGNGDDVPSPSAAP